MKLFKTSSIIICAALVLSACGHDPSKRSGKKIDEYGYVMLKIVTPLSATRATTDSGEGYEKKINDMHIYLFNKDGSGAHTIEHLDDTQFITDVKGVTTLKNPIRTSIQDKFGYIGVNLPQNMVDKISSLRKNLTDVAFEESIANLANTEKSNFVMFTDEIKILASDIYPTADEASKSPVPSSLRRVSSKAAVYYDNTVFLGDGKYAEGSVEFAWKRINKSLYLVQKENKHDPNYNPGELTEAAKDNNQKYITVNEADKIDKFQYTTENTFDFANAKIRTDDATCVSLRVPFQPKQYTVKNGSDWESVPNPAVNSPGADAPDFWIVKTNSSDVYYFSTEETAIKFWTEASSGTITIDGKILIPDDDSYVSRHHVNGMCYYNVYVNGDAGNKSERFNVLRNHYYRFALQQLTSPGDPNWNFDKDQPIVESGYIDFILTIEDWVLIDENINM